MTIHEADEILCNYERLQDKCCTCFQGCAPCSYCIDMPSEEQIKEAYITLNQKET
jgi:hypothetical protein